MALREFDRVRSFQLKHCREVDVEDHGLGRSISDLPDDIITQILSLLTLKEAVSTSLVSRRWRYSWTHLPILNLVHPEVPLDDMDEDAFCRMVNEILRLSRAPRLHQLRIRRFRDCGSILTGHYINSWFAFAIATGVSSLEIHLYHNFSDGYCIPADMFDKAHGIEPYLAPLYDLPNAIPSFGVSVGDRFKSLRELTLRGVRLGDDVFKAIFSSCSMLECLILEEVENLIDAKHSESILHLRRLEIYECDSLENLEISAPNLVSFKYSGMVTNISIKDSEHLVDLFLRYMYYLEENRLHLPSPGIDDFVLPQFGMYFSNLQRLDMHIHFFLKEGRKFRQIPVLHHLKYLTLYSCLARFYHVAASLINASPNLHRLELHNNMTWGSHPTESTEDFVRMIPLSLHGELKEILLNDYGPETAARNSFFGEPLIIMEFLDYIIEHAVAVENIEIRTRDLADAEKHVTFLRQRMPPNAQLKVIFGYSD